MCFGLWAASGNSKRESVPLSKAEEQAGKQMNEMGSPAKSLEAALGVKAQQPLKKNMLKPGQKVGKI
jgi:hypothetical protein